MLQNTFISIEHTKAVSNILFYKLFILNRKDEFPCIWKLIIYQLIKIITRKSNNGNHPLRSCCACQNRDILYFIISFFSKWRATGINEFKPYRRLMEMRSRDLAYCLWSTSQFEIRFCPSHNFFIMYFCLVVMICLLSQNRPNILISWGVGVSAMLVNYTHSKDRRI